MDSDNKLITGQEALSTFIRSISINGTDVEVTDGDADITVDTLPSVTASDNGKVLKVINGAWAVTTPVTVYSGNGTPSSTTGIDGDIYLQTN